MIDKQVLERRFATGMSFAQRNPASLAIACYIAALLLPSAWGPDNRTYTGLGVTLSLMREHWLAFLMCLFFHGVVLGSLAVARRYATVSRVVHVALLVGVAVCLVVAAFWWMRFPGSLYVGFYAWASCLALLAVSLWRTLRQSDDAGEPAVTGEGWSTLRRPVPAMLCVLLLALPTARSVLSLFGDTQTGPLSAAARSASRKAPASSTRPDVARVRRVTPNVSRPANTTAKTQSAGQAPSTAQEESRPAPEWLTEASASAGTGAVAALLGDGSMNYLERGYRDVTLGDTFDEINAKTPLAVNPRGEPFVYRDANGAGYVFTQEGKLICHCRSYTGGPEDYLDRLKDLFGTTDRPILTRDQSMVMSAVSRTYIRYTFPETLAMIEFVSGAALTGGRARQSEATHVFVLDRAWAEDLLRRSADEKTPCLYWMKHASQQIQIGAIEPSSLPPLPDTRIKEIRDGAGAIYIDEVSENTLKDQGNGGEALEQLATVARYAVQDRGKLGLVTFSFARYSGCAVDSFLKQEDNKVSKKSGPAQAIRDTPFLRLLDSELNSLLMQQEFRPRTDEIRFKQLERPTGTVGLGWYEWNHTPDGNNAWTVRCGIEGGMELEYLGDRGL